MTKTQTSVEFIGYDSGWGCADFGCEDGPALAPAAQIMHHLRDEDIAVKWRGPLGLKHLGHHDNIKTKEDALPLVLECLSRLSAQVRRTIASGSLPVVIGGDHSSAIGTWAGVVSAHNAHGNFGLIWIDAHMDAHTHETSHQGKWGGWWHGQPVAALTGQGLRAFTTLGGEGMKISPRHFSIIGSHSFEPAEEEYVRHNGIRVYTLDEVEKRGFATVYAEALARANDGTAGFGLSVDLDAFRNADAPGVGTNETRGLKAAEVLPILRGLGHHAHFRALEIAEFNPHKDINHKTARLIERLVENIFTKH